MLGLSNLAYLNPVMLPALFDLLGLDDWSEELYQKLPGWVRGLWEGFWKVIEDMLVAVFNFDQTFALVEDMVATFKEAFDADGDKWYEIGGNIIKGIVEGLLVPFSFLLEPIVDFFDNLVKNICNVFGIASPAKEMKPYGEYILLGILEGFKEVFEDWWEAIKSWGSTTKDKFKTWASGIWGGIKGEFSNVGTWFKTTFDGAWTNIKTSFSGVKAWFETKYNDITGVFKNIPDWFKDKFTDAWTNVKNVFSTGGKIFDGIKDGIAETFKTVVNGLINGINKIIKTPFEKINSMLNTIRKVSVMGFEPFKNLWSSNPLSIPQIPALAQGGYVGANQPQLAMIGDNKREGEIVSPESKFQEMLNAAAKLSGGGITEEILYRVMSRVFRENQLMLVPDGNGLFKLVRTMNNEYYTQTGKDALVH
jgi:phage-related protein